MRKLWLALLFAVSMCAAPDMAPAQHMHDDTAVSEIEGKFFDHWMRPLSIGGQPRRESSCCSKSDCGVRDIRFVAGVPEFYNPFMKQWQAIPKEILEQNQPDPEESPTGQNYVCHSKVSDTVYCAVLGSLQ